jgi:hypothetical protein
MGGEYQCLIRQGKDALADMVDLALRIFWRVCSSNRTAHKGVTGKHTTVSIKRNSMRSMTLYGNGLEFQVSNFDYFTSL